VGAVFSDAHDMLNLTGSSIETVLHVPQFYSLCVDRESKDAVWCVNAVAKHTKHSMH